MKNVYSTPELDIVILNAEDIIQTSFGTESPWGDLGCGEW